MNGHHLSDWVVVGRERRTSAVRVGDGTDMVVN